MEEFDLKAKELLEFCLKTCGTDPRLLEYCASKLFEAIIVGSSIDMPKKQFDKHYDHRINHMKKVIYANRRRLLQEKLSEKV